MIITFTVLAIIFYLRHKVKALWNKGQCKYIIGTLLLLIASIYLYTVRYPLRSPPPVRTARGFNGSNNSPWGPLWSSTASKSTLLSAETGTLSSYQELQVPVPNVPPLSVPKDSIPSSTPSVVTSTSKVDHECLLPIITPTGRQDLRLKAEPDIDCNYDSLPLLFDIDNNSNIVRATNKSSETDSQYTDCSYRYAVATEVEKDHGDNLSSLVFSKKSFPIAMKNGTTKIQDDPEVIGIECMRQSNWWNLASSSTPELVEIFALVPEKLAVEARLKQLQQDNLAKSGNEERLNVQLIILDNVSQMSFRRAFTQTYDFIMNQLHGVELTGLSIIEDEPAFASIAALLTGQSRSTNRNSTQDLPKTLIWEKFSSQAFYTALVENCPDFFNSVDTVLSFSKTPTDYFPQPSFALFDKISHPKFREECYGPRHHFQVLMDYWNRLANFVEGKVASKSRAYFLTLASCGLTEEKVIQSNVDQYLLKHLRRLKDRNDLNRSAVFLVGNQGLKPNVFKSYYEAIEFRMPTGFVILPEWFYIKYPKAANNLLTNRQPLVTHLDIYETLLDLADLNGLKDESISRMEELNAELPDGPYRKKGISLFLPIPLDRDCGAIGIENELCPCQPDPVQLTLEEDKKAITSTVVTILENINLKLRNYSQCTPLQFSKLHKVLLQGDGNSKSNKVELQNGPTAGSTVHVFFSASPGDQSFVVVLQRKEKNKWTVLRDLSLAERRYDLLISPCISSEERIRNPVLANLCFC